VESQLLVLMAVETSSARDVQRVASEEWFPRNVAIEAAFFRART